MFNLGSEAYFTGDRTKARLWWTRAADYGEPSAMERLAQLAAEDGDAGRSEHWWEQAELARTVEDLVDALDGDTEDDKSNKEDADGDGTVQFNFGVEAADDDRLSEAKSWWERAAHHGHADAMHCLALLADRSGDEDTARGWWEQAGQHDHPDAMFHLGLLAYESGSLGRATRWWKRAAGLNHPDAMFHLGTLHLDRDDPDQARTWWARAAEHGHLPAMDNLGVHAYQSGDIDAARSWWEHAAQQGHPNAQLRLGLIADESGDIDLAKTWLTQAAAQDHPRAMLRLGLLAADDDDLDTARQWWEHAADLGDTESMVNLGTLERILGDRRARTWWNLAAENGDTRAEELLHHLDNDDEHRKIPPGGDTTAPTAADPGTAPTDELATSEGDDPREWVPAVAKRAGDRSYRDHLLAERYAPHIAPLNHFVDQLKAEHGQWLPYLAPTYGGVDARLLSLFQDPGPKTRTGNGTGMLCVENPDDTAARYLNLLATTDIDVSDTVSWNSYPWYLGRPPTDNELEAAIPVLASFITLLPKLEVVLLHGTVAKRAWAKLTRSYPQATSKIRAIPTHHTSPRVIEGKLPIIREHREKRLSADFAHAKSILEESV